VQAGDGVSVWSIPLGTDDLPFHELLRTYRIAAGLSQNQLARWTGVDPAYINRMERSPDQQGSGRSWRPSRQVVLAMADALGLPPGETDLFLWKSDHATIVDWQARALRAEDTLTRIRQMLEEP
jgi:transcriptional regulator with XRE-family HTH domain